MMPPRSRRPRLLLNILILLSLTWSLPSFVTAGYDPVDRYSAAPAGFSCDSVTEIPKTECEALVALYNSSSGAGWNYRTAWLLTSTPCSWFGVTCTSNRVTEIELIRNDLTGSIPSELADLANLERLDLAINELGGAIPPELGGLSHLKYLRLDSNDLSGVIPAEISGMVSLQSLSLRSNKLYGSIPPTLGALTNLERLDLAENLIGGSLPPELGRLTKLKGLSLYDMELGGTIPRELGNLSSLERLSLFSNHIYGVIPPEIANLANLEDLWLSDNNLSGSLPSAMGNMRNLGALGLSGNPLAGPLPSTMTQLPLHSFDFSDTYLCEREDAAFQTWLSGISDLSRTNIICSNPQARGYVFLDTDEDGTRDASETEGLVDIHVYVTQGGSKIRSALTIDGGWYEFHDLPESYLCVKPEMPAGYALTTQAERCSSFAYGYIVDAYFGVREEPATPTPTPTETVTPTVRGVWLPMIIR